MQKSGLSVPALIVSTALLGFATLLPSLACAEEQSSRAQEGHKVRVQLASCSGVDTDSVESFLRIELGERYQEPATSGAHFLLRLECRSDGVSLFAAKTGSFAVAHTLDASELESEVSARVIALTLIELLHAAELRESDKPDGEAPDSVSHDKERPVELRIPVALLSASYELLLFPQGDSYSGADLSLHWLGVRPLFFRTGLALDTNTNEYETGTVKAHLVSGSVEAGLFAERGPAHFGAGAGLRLGSATLDGTASQAEQASGRVSGLFFGPFLGAFLGAEILPHVEALSRAQVGGALSKVSGSVAGEEDVSLDGVWVSLHFGVGAVW